MKIEDLFGIMTKPGNEKDFVPGSISMRRKDAITFIVQLFENEAADLYTLLHNAPLSQEDNCTIAMYAARALQTLLTKAVVMDGGYPKLVDLDAVIIAHVLRSTDLTIEKVCEIVFDARAIELECLKNEDQIACLIQRM